MNSKFFSLLLASVLVGTISHAQTATSTKKMPTTTSVESKTGALTLSPKAKQSATKLTPVKSRSTKVTPETHLKVAPKTSTTTARSPKAVTGNPKISRAK